MGTINGQTIGVLADTGAEVNVMSRTMAERLGLNIHDGEEYKATLKFADGSVAVTSGMVLGAQRRFGADHSSSTHLLDFHILDDLPCGVVLCNENLYDNQVFSLYEDHFHQEQLEDQSSDVAAYLYFIILRKWGKVRASSLAPEVRDKLEQVHGTIDAEAASTQSDTSPTVHPVQPADNRSKRHNWLVRILRRGAQTSGTTGDASSSPPP